MSTRQRLSEDAILEFVSAHSGWSLLRAPAEAISKTYAFSSYPDGIAFVVRLGFAAEKRDHHPDLSVHWGKVRVDFSTHDAGGVTGVDLEMAELCDRLYKGFSE